MTKRRTSWLCRATWATALLPLALLAPSAASAAPPAGGVTALGCIQNSGGGACPATSPALDGAEGVAVSPDGANVYVASDVSDAIAIFARNADGSLTYSGCIENTGAPVTCAASANALDGPRAVAVSPDGANVYVSAFDNATLSETFVTLDRASGGALSDGMSCFRGSNGYAGCPSGSLGDPRGIGISADGGSLYVAVSTSPGGITRFTRGFGGDVTFNGTSGLGILNAPFRVVVSPDGGNIYTAGTVSDDIVWIPRNADGSLILASAGCLIKPPGGGGCVGTAEGLDGAQGVAVSPDNANVYVVSPLRDTIAVFTRGAGGVLASTGCVKDPGSPASCAATALGLDGAADVAASPDGQNVYVVSQNPGSAVVAFERGAGGALTEINCVQNTGGAACGTAPGLNTPQALALSPDGLNLYVASFASDAVAWFARNRAPSCSGSTASTSAKTPVTVVLACSDPNGDPATRSIASGPARGTLGAIDQGAGRATYTPRAGFSGTDSFTFVGSDGGATSSPATVNLSVGSAPALRGLRVVPKRFRRGSGLPRLARRVRTGATIRFTLSEAATVGFTFARKLLGRRVGRKCRRPTRPLQRRKRCTRYVRAGSLKINGSAGASKLRFQGRLSRRKALRAGRYRLTVVPSNLAGATGTARRTSFTLLPASRQRH